MIFVEGGLQSQGAGSGRFLWISISQMIVRVNPEFRRIPSGAEAHAHFAAFAAQLKLCPDSISTQTTSFAEAEAQTIFIGLIGSTKVEP
jgi:hypothetical protein